ncbi:TonB-dependent receptor [uncultured Kiloniella sp.]|uniref:TonB-dependent receptor n=1 Tax=uncultured Kiloniella sp. TaxID=1133091 RepID=UPI002617034C|nr:TonB-dependent receptor [uncultured Kiloniella sp.]
MLNCYKKTLLSSCIICSAVVLVNVPRSGAFAEGGKTDEEGKIQLEPVYVTAQKRDEVEQEVPISMEVFTADELEKQNLTSVFDIIQKTPNLSVRTGANGGDSQITIRGLGAQLPYVDSSVPVFVDGVAIPASQAMMLLKNADRVEVLRGPQSTLFGHNAIAGAINIETKLPSDEFEGQIQGGVGTRDHYQGDLYLSGPIMDKKLYGSFTMSGTTGDGFVKNLSNDKNADKYDTKYMQGKLRALPNDNLELRLNLDLSDRNGPARYWTDRPNYTVTSTDNLKEETHSRGGSFDVIYDFDEAELRSLTNMRQTKIDSLFAWPYKIDSKEEIYSQEIRLSSVDEDSPLSWLAAAYVSHERNNVNQDIPAYPAIYDTDLKTQNYAMYGNLGYDVTDRWNINVGTRFTRVDRKADQLFSFGGTSTTLDYDETFYGFTPKVSTTYALTPSTNIYGSIASGFKPGTVNFAASNASNQKVDSEKSINYEIGAKGRLANDRISYGAAVFYTDFSNYQAYDTLLNAINIKRAYSRGIEANLSALLTDEWQIGGSVGYLDTEITKSKDQSYEGNNFAISPELTARISTTYEKDLGQNLTGYITADITYQSETDYNLANDDKIEGDAYALLNASIGIDYQNLSLALHGKNLTDKKYAAEISTEKFWTPGARRSVLATLAVKF